MKTLAWMCKVKVQHPIFSILKLITLVKNKEILHKKREAVWSIQVNHHAQIFLNHY